MVRASKTRAPNPPVSFLSINRFIPVLFCLYNYDFICLLVVSLFPSKHNVSTTSLTVVATSRRCNDGVCLLGCSYFSFLGVSRGLYFMIVIVTFTGFLHSYCFIEDNITELTTSKRYSVIVCSIELWA